jgi:uroporphyrinogen-III synthase
VSLAGRRVLVTRPPDEAAELSARLRDRGAEPIEAPTIEIRPVAGETLDRLDAAVRDLADGRFAWVVFTSVRAVDAVLGRLAAQGYGPFPSVVRASRAAIGAASAGRLRDAGVEPDLVPEAFTTQGLAEAFPAGRGRVLTPRADVAPEGLETALAAKGWDPLRVDAYRTVFPDTLPPEAARALGSGAVDAIAFTSVSTVRGFVRVTAAPAGAAIVCIGPVTASACEANGIPVAAVADPHTVDGLVMALERHFEKMTG